MKDKPRLIFMAVLSVILLAVVLLFGYMMISKNEVNPGGIISFAIPVILVVFMVFFIIRRYRDVKEGMPMEDERSKKVINRAAAMAFYTSLYWLLFISMFEEFFAKVLFNAEHLDAGNVVGGGIAGMALFLAGYWLYYNSRADLK